jgi:hypothetical protein
LTARFYINDSTTWGYLVRIRDKDQTIELAILSASTPPGAIGWFDVALASNNITVTGDFYVCFEEDVANYRPHLGIDTGPGTIAGRSYFGTTPKSPLVLDQPPRNDMIRVVIDPTYTPKPVGGVVIPTNKLALATLYLALAGLVAAVSAVAFSRRRHVA